MSNKAACILFAIGMESASALAESPGTGLYLYEIPVRLSDAAALSLGDGLRADFYVQQPDHVAHRLVSDSGLTVLSSSDRYVRVYAANGATLRGHPGIDHLAASFVVDYEEPSVAALRDAMYKKYGSQPSPTELISFVHGAISEKSLRRSFDVASQVADSREGDCSEHAVLLAALARAAGRPARIVLGIMLLEHDGELSSFGHALTEIHDGERWQTADATRPELELPDASIFYFPMSELDNEGPGYSMGIMQFAMIKPARIERVSSVPLTDSGGLDQASPGQ